MAHRDYFLSAAVKHATHALAPTYESHVSRWPYNHLYEQNSEGFIILRHVIQGFVATAEARNETPIVVIFPKRETAEIIQLIRRSHIKT